MPTPRDRAFGLIELLVAVLILSTLMAVALPLYLRATGDAGLKACRANMRSIANAVHAARVEEVGTTYAHEIARNRAAIDIGTSPGCLDSLSAVPACPSGGAYTVEKGSSGTPETFRVRCSVAAHSTFEPGIDHL